MAVSKRLRYEILRRDNRTCRYCGAGAPDAPLCVDHVVPSAAGWAQSPFLEQHSNEIAELVGDF
ncbi:HNH endonuclease [Streptomyces sp. NPDC015184]|uniref:HNH endonuclease n=1 Tax=Streptomyces sp. NPDC015184 TaxID=3364946 RepID=UPI0036FA19BE